MRRYDMIEKEGYEEEEHLIAMGLLLKQEWHGNEDHIPCHGFGKSL